MQISSESVLGWRNGIERHDCADLSAMTNAVGNHVHEHLLARHAARGAAREREVDLLGQSGLGPSN